MCAAAQGSALSLFLFVVGSFPIVIPSPKPRIPPRPIQSRRARNLATHWALVVCLFCSSIDPSALRVCKQTLHSTVSRLRMTTLQVVIPSPKPRIPTRPMQSRRARNLATHWVLVVCLFCSSIDPSLLSFRARNPGSPQTDAVAKGEESSDALGLDRLLVLFVARSFGAQSLRTDAAFHCFAPQDDNITGCHSEPATPDSPQTDPVAKGEESSDALGLDRLLVLFVDRSFGAESVNRRCIPLFCASG